MDRSGSKEQDLIQIISHDKGVVHSNVNCFCLFPQ